MVISLVDSYSFNNVLYLCKQTLQHCKTDFLFNVDGVLSIVSVCIYRHRKGNAFELQQTLNWKTFKRICFHGRIVFFCCYDAKHWTWMLNIQWFGYCVHICDKFLNIASIGMLFEPSPLESTALAPSICTFAHSLQSLNTGEDIAVLILGFSLNWKSNTIHTLCWFSWKHTRTHTRQLTTVGACAYSAQSMQSFSSMKQHFFIVYFNLK